MSPDNTITHKLIDAGTSFVANASGLPTYRSREIMERSTLRALANRGLTPASVSDQPVETRLQIIHEFLILLGNELNVEKIPAPIVQEIQRELLAFYASLKGLNAGAAADSAGHR
jgi:hypothetical protein